MLECLLTSEHRRRAHLSPCHRPCIPLGGVRKALAAVRKEHSQLGAFQYADALLRGKGARLRRDFPRRDVDAARRLARAPRIVELAQRLDPGARRLPALAREERGARAFLQLEVDAGLKPRHGIAIAAESR